MVPPKVTTTQRNAFSGLVEGAMIYNTSASNRAIAVISFGGTVASTAGTFTVTMPTADLSNAIIRLA